MTNKSFPNLRLVYKPQVDAKYAVRFLTSRRKYAKFLHRFFPPQLHFIFNKNFSNKEREKIISGYVKGYYRRNHNDIAMHFLTTKKDWRKTKDKYFTLVDKLFNNRPWPKGKYVGVGTIFWCYPRFISEKTFLFPLNTKIPHYANKVIGHEMLHFIFFDYIQQKYGLRENSRIRGKESNYVWKVSEAFNNVVEGWTPYYKLFNSIPPRPYPETMNIYKKMKKQWEYSHSVDQLLDKVFI